MEGNEFLKVMFRFLFCLYLFCAVQPCVGQAKVSVQVKAFDKQLKPFSNIELSINGSEYLSIGSKGSVFADILQEDLPPKSIKIKNDDFEAESWNYSKGILEIIVRKKNYKVVSVNLRNAQGKPLPNVEVTFIGRSTLRQKTNTQGVLELVLANDEKITGGNQFSVHGFTAPVLQGSEKELSLVVQEVVKHEASPKTSKPDKPFESFRDFDLKNLDSIRSLTVFYAVFKNYPIDKLPESDKARIDRKFKQLIAQLQDSVKNPARFLGRISDSSFVANDLENLLAQAEAEKATLDELREGFDQKIQVLNEKLAGGAVNLDPGTRNKLLADISRLETILRLNEEKFYRNQSNYQSVLNSLKEKFFDIQDLENKLYLSESQRQVEREEFRRKIYVTLTAAVGFAAIAIILIYFSNRLKKQQRQLISANAEVKRINENLEGLVRERTALLENAHREMDIFLYKASHDLRGPICSIIGLCNIASRTVNQESVEIVQMTYNTAYAMDRMLKKLKVISEINHPSNYSNISLFDHLKHIRAEYQTFLRDHNVQLELNCPPGLTFYSYPNLIDVILINLIENALNFSTLVAGRTATVVVNATKHDDMVEIRVWDNGIGIEHDIHDRIWEMFFIGNESSHGNGLGLYIVKKSVEALNGSITVESKPGAFTQFTARVPHTVDISHVETKMIASL